MLCVYRASGKLCQATRFGFEAGCSFRLDYPMGQENTKMLYNEIIF